jgi:succinate dehydrogenase/fumarate reductase flavoprotein subunit
VVRPRPIPLKPHLHSGYLVKASSVRDLAQAVGVDADTLHHTVERFNQYARQGQDPDYNRGSSALERRNGDPTVAPNPCLGALETPPFYALRVLPGEFSTLAGLRTDEYARVLDAHDRPVPGLYAAGSDASSMFGGSSPAGGATLGPALTFGFIAGKHLAERSTAATGNTNVSVFSGEHQSS